ncbi:MAG: small ribosomal subunit Rsm22 family protein [Chthoniobacteraceae bacterium]
MLKHWNHDEMAALRAMRARFLERTAGETDYWHSLSEIELYDRTFGARIGWKINAALRAAQVAGWSPRTTRLLDWGCGSGVASRCLIEAWPRKISRLALHDRSIHSRQYAEQCAGRAFPNLTIERTDRVDGETLVVLSHVISELNDAALAELLTKLRAAAGIVWIEAGTHADSRRLIQVREALRDIFGVVAPCTHQARCGMLVPVNARHWCHHFAQPPTEIFQDAAWAEWSREMEIDLRSLPYSYLILERETGACPDLQGASRIIGTPREAKGYCRILSCQHSGVEEWMLQKRDDAGLFKRVLKHPEQPPYRWERRDGKIVGGTELENVKE